MIYTAIWAVLAALAGHVLTVIALLHARVALAPVLLHAASALLWHALQILALLALGASVYYWHSAAVFALGVMVLVFGFSGVYKSISLRLLLLLATRGAPVSVSDIHEKLVMKSFCDRVEMLLSAGLIARTHAGYALTDAGRQAARRILALKAFFGSTASGLYFRNTVAQRRD